MRVMGMQSGTSHDGIDLAVVDFETDGETLLAHLVHTACVPYSDELRRLLIDALPPARTTVEQVCALDTGIGQEFARAAAAAQDVVGALPVICSHGQTLFHGVAGGRVWGTLQLGQPAWIAEATGATVVSDVRTRDVAAGGHGAPLVALLDTLLARSLGGRTGLVNIGGICNITVVGDDAVLAYDLGPGNALIDAAMRAHPAVPAEFDQDGRAASRGRVDPDLLSRLLDEPYYALAPPKTTGKEVFNAHYLAEHCGGASGDDLVATLTELTVRLVADATSSAALDRVVVSGGGTRNPVLMSGLRRSVAPVDLLTSQSLGVPTDAKEAVAFALIGWLTIHELPGTLAAATGARGPRVLGTVIPGRARLPAPDSTPMPVRLRLVSA